MARKNTRDWFLERLPAKPADLEQWTRENQAKAYIYFKRNAKSVTGWCSACDSNVYLKTATNGRYAICPHCGRRVKLLEDRTATFCEVLVTQVLDNFCDNRQIVQFYKITYFTKYKNVAWTTSKLEFDVAKGDFFGGGISAFDVQCYKNGVDCRSWYKPSYELDWRLGRFAVSGGTGLNSLTFGKFLYANNLIDILPNESKSIETFIKFAKENQVNNVFAYLAQYEFIPQIEYLIKLGFINLAKEFLKGRVSVPRPPASPLFNINENNIIKFLGCRDKNYFKKLPKKVSAEDLRYSDRVKQKFNVEICNPQYATFKTFYKNHFDLIKELEEYASFKTILNYYETQKKKEKSFSNFMMDYRDYLCAAVALKLNLADTAILKPYNFREMHDRTCDTWTNLKNKEKNKPFKEVLKKYKLNFEDETYKIIIPANISDIVAEGRNNNNCVGNYVDRVINGRSIVVFARNKKDLKKSLVTVEINPATFKIVQSRGRSNSFPPAEITNFLNTYSQKVLVKEYGRLQKASTKLARELHCKNENKILEA